ELSVHFLALRGKLPVVLDDFLEQQRNEAEWETAKHVEPARRDLPRERRIAREVLGRQLPGLHDATRDQPNSSATRVPCANRGEKPKYAPNVGTRSSESIGRSITTFSRTPGPITIIHVVRERASPVR